MTTKEILLIAAGAVLALAGAFYAGASYSERHYGAKADAAQTQSDQHEGAALDHAAQAAGLKQQASAQAAVVGQSDIGVAEAKRKLAALQKVTQPVVGPGRPAALSEGVEPPQVAVIEADRDHYKALYEQALDVIAAEDKDLAASKLQASIERARGDQLQAALDESQKALAMQKIADDAKIRSEHASGLKSQLLHVGEAAVTAFLVGKYAH